MRFVPVNCIKEGMIVGKKLLGKNNELLLNTGTVIQPEYVVKLKRLGYNGIYIEDLLSKDIEIDEIINENLRIRTIKTLKSAFHHIEDGDKNPDKSIESILKLADEIIEEVLSNRDLIVNIIDLKVFDDYTFYHSVNVTVLSMVIGITMHLNKTILFKLCLTSLLHDIGKVFIPLDLLNKPGRLNPEEYELVKQHSFKGYEFLKTLNQISSSVYTGVLHHHERYDGSGYPMNFKGDKISLMARIIAVADVYDALTSDRPYRKAMNPSDAIELLMGAGGTQFDPDVVTAFLKKIAPYPLGTLVSLSNKKTGLVVKNYNDSCLRPQIKIIKENENEVEPYIIDLKNDKDLKGTIITGIVNN